MLPQLLGEDAPHTESTRGAVPYTVFLDPPFSRVGLSVEQAKKDEVPVTVYKMPVAEIPEAKITESTEGHWKILVDDDGIIVGATMFGAESQEYINLLTFAVNEKWHYDKLGDAIYNHPVVVEGLNMIFAPEWKQN